MKIMFVVVCCYVNITDVCHGLDTNTIINKETKANTKAIFFDKNTNTDIQDHLKVIIKTVIITKIIQYTTSYHLL